MIQIMLRISIKVLHGILSREFCPINTLPVGLHNVMFTALGSSLVSRCIKCLPLPRSHALKPLQALHSEGLKSRDRTLPTHTWRPNVQSRTAALQLTNHIETHWKPPLAAKYCRRLIWAGSNLGALTALRCSLKWDSLWIALSRALEWNWMRGFLELLKGFHCF